MSEHLIQDLVEDYCLQRLSAEEYLFVSMHMQNCEACRMKIEQQLDEDFYALRIEVFGSEVDPSHLSFEQKAAYIDEVLAGEEFKVVK